MTLGREQGVIPMSIVRPSLRPTTRLYRIGTAGGQVKRSSAAATGGACVLRAPVCRRSPQRTTCASYPMCRQDGTGSQSSAPCRPLLSSATVFAQATCGGWPDVLGDCVRQIYLSRRQPHDPPLATHARDVALHGRIGCCQRRVASQDEPRQTASRSSATTRYDDLASPTASPIGARSEEYTLWCF
jgi:hypothetical protein